MARTASPRTVAVRDQLLAILRAEYPMPLSTNEILVRISNGGRNCDSYLASDRQCDHKYTPPPNCPAWCWHSRAYVQLTALTNINHVERLRLDEMRCVYWRYVPDNETTAALAAWEADA